MAGFELEAAMLVHRIACDRCTENIAASTDPQMASHYVAAATELTPLINVNFVTPLPHHPGIRVWTDKGEKDGRFMTGMEPGCTTKLLDGPPSDHEMQQPILYSNHLGVFITPDGRHCVAE